jgi:hypothetical protein
MLPAICGPSLTNNPPSLDPSFTIDLHSLSYACIAGIPQPECSILVFGFKATGEIVTENVIFPALELGHYIDEFWMNGTTFGEEWSGLKGIAFSMTRSEDGGDMYGGLAIDDLEYSLNTLCECVGEGSGQLEREDRNFGIADGM